MSVGCPRCGRSLPSGAVSCACGAVFAQTGVATASATPLPVDTTGLSEGATFSTAALTGELSQTSAPTIGEAVRVERRTIGPAGSSAGPLQIGQAFGPRYHILKLLGA